MSSKERLCTHCGRFIADDDSVRVCEAGGFAHSGCEFTNYGDWHDAPAPGLLRSLYLVALGAWEFRRDLTTHFDHPEVETYDTGREWAHRLTLRHWDGNR